MCGPHFHQASSWGGEVTRQQARNCILRVYILKERAGCPGIYNLENSNGFLWSHVHSLAQLLCLGAVEFDCDSLDPFSSQAFLNEGCKQHIAPSRLDTNILVSNMIAPGTSWSWQHCFQEKGEGKANRSSEWHLYWPLTTLISPLQLGYVCRRVTYKNRVSGHWSFFLTRQLLNPCSSVGRWCLKKWWVLSLLGMIWGVNMLPLGLSERGLEPSPWRCFGVRYLPQKSHNPCWNENLFCWGVWCINLLCRIDYSLWTFRWAGLSKRR